MPEVMSQRVKELLKRSPLMVSLVRGIRRSLWPELYTFSLCGTRYKVLKEGFWRRLAEGKWEPQTLSIFKTYIDNDTAYFDVGCWIGPAILFANAAGAKTIVGVEANPVTFQVGQNQLHYESTRIKSLQASPQMHLLSGRRACLVWPSNGGPRHELLLNSWK